jgi:hypothetical protein
MFFYLFFILSCWFHLCCSRDQARTPKELGIDLIHRWIILLLGYILRTLLRGYVRRHECAYCDKFRIYDDLFFFQFRIRTSK